MFGGFDNSYSPMWHNGPKPGAFYNFPATSTSSPKDEKQRDSQPITTGSSVIAFKYDTGVVISADTLISYGKLLRYRNVDRVFKVNDHTIIGVGGEYADFQFIKKYIDQKVTEDYCYDDNLQLKPKSLFNWLTRVLYNKRCRFAPLWIDIVIGGLQDGVPFLGHVDHRGRAYEDAAIATGYGKHLALPLIREKIENQTETLNAERAVELSKSCMEVLFYRDCQSYPQYKIATCDGQGARVDGPINVAQNWEQALNV
ncbi:Proteasome subunit beta type-4 [Pseudolycoriella hygida]|uniref:Proteasome subunit beta n=1 Tax=Pseudolycoriella hygida TaxID=35572 RepID=A0A9Q0S3B0_9DIPT|nr:Proteasome subunit beta type-4 [Pseudolycoriella hygida]